MTHEEAIIVISSVAWLGNENDRKKIERAIKKLSEIPTCSEKQNNWIPVSKGLPDIKEHHVEEQPTIEPRKGKWERHYSRPNVYADLFWHCSECGFKSDNQYAYLYYNFCPNCGADMRGEQDE